MKAAENKLEDTYIANTNTFIFDETNLLHVLPLFETHTNGKVSINNRTYSGNSVKIHLKININYSWIGAEYPPRYSLVVMKNNVTTLSVFTKV